MSMVMSGVVVVESFAFRGSPSASSSISSRPLFIHDSMRDVGRTRSPVHIPIDNDFVVPRFSHIRGKGSG